MFLSIEIATVTLQVHGIQGKNNINLQVHDIQEKSNGSLQVHEIQENLKFACRYMKYRKT